MTDVNDDYDPDYEAAQRAAEDPPDWYLEEEAERHYQRHCDENHGGAECDCPPPEWPRCRLIYRIPRRAGRRHWTCGTPGGCDTAGQTPRGAWRAHQAMHVAPF